MITKKQVFLVLRLTSFLTFLHLQHRQDVEEARRRGGREDVSHRRVPQQRGEVQPDGDLAFKCVCLIVRIITKLYSFIVNFNLKTL